MWPGFVPFATLAARKFAEGKAVNFAAARDWFTPLYAAWKEDIQAVVTIADVLAFFETDSA